MYFLYSQLIICWDKRKDQYNQFESVVTVCEIVVLK